MASSQGAPACPLTPEHGGMYDISGSGVYYCPNNEHNTNPPTQAIWPYAEVDRPSAYEIYAMERKQKRKR